MWTFCGLTMKRLATPGAARLTRSNLKRGLTLIANRLVRAGLLADYRRPFWRMAWQAIKRGQIEALFGVGFIAYHLIEFSREALRGQQNASFYSARTRNDRFVGLTGPLRKQKPTSLSGPTAYRGAGVCVRLTYVNPITRKDL
jgi:hypothetical protein